MSRECQEDVSTAITDSIENSMQLPIEEDEEMRLPGFHLGQDLSSYMAALRKVLFSPNNDTRVTVVLGNPSCDLDSFICAFVLSYFYNGRANPSKHHQHPIYVPVLNLPFIEAKDLWRLRPEFGVAMKCAFDGLTPQSSFDNEESLQQEYQRKYQKVTEQLFTVHELANNESTASSLRQVFQPSRQSDPNAHHEKQDVVLVDHNAPAIETINQADLRKRFSVVGCVDHHVEEEYVPKNAQPRIVKLGIGSCMSLVMQHLRSLNLWSELPKSNKAGFQQLARLALTPVLVDTWNLKATGDKCSELDKEQAAFLISHAGQRFQPDDLFEQANTAKLESINLLLMQEILGRDYKSYVETNQSSGGVNIGITSIVQDPNWLSKHAGGEKHFVEEIVKFSRQGEKLLDSFSMLTRSGDEKQVAVFGFTEPCRAAINTFERDATEMKLTPWTENPILAKHLDDQVGKDSWGIWRVGDTSKSRKQVAPLLRHAVRQHL